MLLLAILFIVTGILIAIYPQLLAIIVASFLIFFGIVLLYLRFHFRRVSKEFESPFIDFFTRY